MSISANIWCDSEELQIFYDQIRAAPLPFEESWSTEEFTIGLKIFIDMLLEELYGKDSASKYIQENLLEQRYVPVFGVTLDREHFCRTAKSDSWTSFESEMRQRRLERIKMFGNLFREILTFTSEKSIMNTLVSNYIEQLVENFLSIEAVNPFLQNCFDEGLEV